VVGIADGLKSPAPAFGLPGSVFLEIEGRMLLKSELCKKRPAAFSEKKPFSTLKMSEGLDIFSKSTYPLEALPN